MKKQQMDPFRNFASTNILLNGLLATAIPKWIDRIQRNGGPEPCDFAEARQIGEGIGCEGDKLMFKTKNPEETAQLFNDLAYALAVAAFRPGGIRFGGEHYQVGKL